MNVVYMTASGRGDADLVLAAFAQHLEARGLQSCGTVQINTERDDGHPCDMDVMVLPDGPVFRISQTLGREARGCRLDPAALEEAVSLASARLKAGAGVLIVNKFGKHEADGRGFRTLIADALERGIPVIVGLNPLNGPAFEEFTGGCAQPVGAQTSELLAWFDGLKEAT